MRGMTAGDRVWVLHVGSLFFLLSKLNWIPLVLWAATMALMLLLDYYEHGRS